MIPVRQTVALRLVRAGYRCAYAAARAWWWWRRPRTAGALVSLRVGDDILLLRTSYRPLGSLPGGFVGRHETPVAAAVRELGEELSLHVDAGRLVFAWRGTQTFESRTDTVTVFELRLTERPPLRIDGAEVVWAAWMPVSAARRQPLLPHVRAYLESVV